MLDQHLDNSSQLQPTGRRNHGEFSAHLADESELSTKVTGQTGQLSVELVFAKLWQNLQEKEIELMSSTPRP